MREQVGRGGFGIVWRAHDNLLRRDLAVKAASAWDRLQPVFDAFKASFKAPTS